MYVNYGDKDFFEHGLLIDTEHSDTEIRAICCEPYLDEEDLYQFGVCTVDITDSWIDREGVMKFIGMTEETFDPVTFANGCLSHYSWDNFGAISYNSISKEKPKTTTELAYAKIISHNKKNLEREFQSERRQQGRQENRAKRRDEEI